jgi:hypothetical protein
MSSDSGTRLDLRDDPYVGTDVVHHRFPMSTSARQRWEQHPNPTLRFPKGVKFTPGGRLFWKQSELNAWEKRVHEHTRNSQFDPEELPGMDWLPSNRETLEAEIAKLRETVDVLHVEVERLRAENESVREENKALNSRNVELCRELAPPVDLEAECAR